MKKKQPKVFHLEVTVFDRDQESPYTSKELKIEIKRVLGQELYLDLKGFSLKRIKS